MEKQHWLGIAVGFIGGIWSAMVGCLGEALSVLIVIMAADYMTGLLSAFVNKELNSAIGTKGFIKKLVVLILIGLIYLLEGVGLNTQHVGDGVAIAYIAIEFISITENAGRLGVPLGPVEKFIAILKDKGENK